MRSKEIYKKKMFIEVSHLIWTMSLSVSDNGELESRQSALEGRKWGPDTSHQQTVKVDYPLAKQGRLRHSHIYVFQVLLSSSSCSSDGYEIVVKATWLVSHTIAALLSNHCMADSPLFQQNGLYQEWDRCISVCDWARLMAFLTWGSGQSLSFLMG